ncbi:arginase family protein [Sungkyunkwania multivorans]|uniref:Arginase family protein n=1 Tax=Sungkyunkwania multivorans TaxID=1173618 RepID=A0ABW3CUQ3_9FLAO
MKTTVYNKTRSPFFIIEKERSILNDTISGKKYEVGEEVLHFAATRRNISDVDKLTEREETILSNLLSIGFFVDKDNLLKTTYRLRLRNEKMFDFADLRPEENGKIALVGVPFGKGNYTSDKTKHFPEIFRKTCASQNLTFRNNLKALQPGFISSFSNYSLENLSKALTNDLFRDAGDVYVHHYESRLDFYKKLEKIAEELYTKHTPFFVGGDHSITYSTLKAAAKKYPKITVLHFDAHTDTYSSNYNEILNQLQLHHHGNFVSKIIDDPSIVNYVQIGIRGLGNSSGQKHPKIKAFWAHQLEKLAKGQIFSQDPEMVYYITFDIDVLDPSFAPGTATPVVNGLSVAQVYELFDLLLENKRIIGGDIVEVNIEKDQNNVTIGLATEIIFKLLSYINV